MIPEYYKGIHGQGVSTTGIQIIIVEERRTVRTLYGFFYFVRYLSLSRLICKGGIW